VQGYSLWHFLICLHYTFVRFPPPSLSIIHPPYLKQWQKLSLFYFMYVYKFVHHIHSSLSCPCTLTLPMGTCLHRTYFTCLSFLILKSSFKGISWCISAVNILYLVSLAIFIITPYFFPPTFHYQLSVCIIRSYVHRDVMYFHIVDSYHSLSFPSPEFNSIVWLLQTCFIYKCVITAYDHVFFVYTFNFCICIPHMRENMWPLPFWTWLTSLNLCRTTIWSSDTTPEHKPEGI
jgi:hypothetical protein